MRAKQILAGLPVLCGILLAVAAGAVLAQGKVRTAGGGGDAGMVVTGDHEAPMVLTIIPWQEPKLEQAPGAPLLEVLPTALDRDQGVAEGYLAKPLPGALSK